jgi:DNA replication protein DnaC
MGPVMFVFDVSATELGPDSPPLPPEVNLPFERWPEVLGSERLTGAVLDRLTHRCHILEATGESYR